MAHSSFLFLYFNNPSNNMRLLTDTHTFGTVVDLPALYITFVNYLWGKLQIFVISVSPYRVLWPTTNCDQVYETILSRNVISCGTLPPPPPPPQSRRRFPLFIISLCATTFGFFGSSEIFLIKSLKCVLGTKTKDNFFQISVGALKIGATGWFHSISN